MNENEKNSGLINQWTTFLFNDWINRWALMEISISNRVFTWSNNQAHPTLEKLDRILMNSEWEDLFPLVTTRKLVRDISDHNPLLLSTNSACPQAPKPREFRFEMSWMAKEEFLPLVEKNLAEACQII